MNKIPQHFLLLSHFLQLTSSESHFSHKKFEWTKWKFRNFRRRSWRQMREKCAYLRPTRRGGGSSWPMGTAGDATNWGTRTSRTKCRLVADPWPTIVCSSWSDWRTTGGSTRVHLSSVMQMKNFKWFQLENFKLNISAIPSTLERFIGPSFWSSSIVLPIVW